MDSIKNVQFSSNKECRETISKSKIKKIKRYEEIVKKNKYRKQKLQELKIARAKAEGRDLDIEKKQQHERTISGEGRKRRDMNWSKRLVNAKTSFKVSISYIHEQ